MKLQLSQDAASLFRDERLVQSGAAVRTQIVEHDANPFRIGEVPVDQVLHLVSELHIGVLLRDGARARVAKAATPRKLQA
jgi:hypothetical protein